MKKNILFLLVMLLLSSACGGAATEAEPPAQEETAVTDETTVDEGVVEEETEAESATEETEEMAETPTEAPAEEVIIDDAPTEEAVEEVVEDASPSGFGDILMSGSDPDTGLEINPASYGPGDTFIVRGTIISMNLTPVSSPEFLIESPDSVRYRIRSQAVSDIYFIDGSQWQAFEFRQGVGAMATVVFDSSAALTDIPFSEDLVLVMQE